MSAFQRLVGALESGDYHVTGAGRTRASRCPSHDDGQASLSVTQGQDRVLVKCHAGCETEDVLAALGLATADLFDAPKQRGTGNGFQILESYRYVAEDGTLLFTVHRCSTADTNKTFRQQLPDGSWKLGHVRRVIYRLPTVLDSLSRNETVFVAEGEKDVHALESVGVVATCNPGGAGKWQDEYSGIFKDHNVVVIADRDKPGRAHAEQVRTSLKKAGATVTVVEAAEGKDAADHLAAGHTVGKFVPVSPSAAMQSAAHSPETDPQNPQNPAPTEGFEGFEGMKAGEWPETTPLPGATDPIPIDALGTVLGANDYRAKEVRHALEPLVQVADRTNALLLGLCHFTKATGDDPLMLVSGSAAFGQLVRAAVAFAEDKGEQGFDEDENAPVEDVAAPTERTFVCSTIKNNLGREDLPSLVYRIAPWKVDTPSGDAWVSRLEFTSGAACRSVRDILRSAHTGIESGGSRQQDAAEWLKTHLGSAKKPSADVKAAAETAGYSARTLGRARTLLDVDVVQEGFPCKSYWSLPVRDSSGAKPFGTTGAGTTEGTYADLQKRQNGHPQKSQSCHTRVRGATALTDEKPATDSGIEESQDGGEPSSNVHRIRRAEWPKCRCGNEIYDRSGARTQCARCPDPDPDGDAS